MRHWRGPLLFVALLAVLVLPRVTSSAPLGLADNGDYERMLARVGLAHPPGPPGGRYFGYVNLHYVFAPSRDNGYWSSALLPAGGARLLAAAAGAPAFDLRVLGALHAISMLSALGWVGMELARLRWPALTLTAGLALVVIADAGYVAYLNSFYAEPFVAVCWWLMLAAALACCRGPGERPSVLRIAGFVTAASMLVLAKLQCAPLAVPLALLAIQLGRSLRPALRVLAILPILLAGLASWRAVPQRFVEANLYNVVFDEITAHSTDVASDLGALGLDPALARYAGTTAYDAGLPLRDPGFRAAFTDRIGYQKVFAFYAGNPGRLWRLAARAARDAFELRPRYLGNQVAAAGGPPKQQSTRLALWSSTRQRLLPGSFWFVLGALGALAALQWWAARRTSSPALAEAFRLLAWVPLLALLQYLGVIVGEGTYELVKHLFLYNLGFDTALLAAIGALVLICGRR
jgi:hypothetical protein